MTLKGVAAVDVASMVGAVLSEELPGMLRRRPVLSGGDSVERGLQNVKMSLKVWKNYMFKELNILWNTTVHFLCQEFDEKTDTTPISAVNSGAKEDWLAYLNLI